MGGSVTPSFDYFCKQPGLADETVRREIYGDFAGAVGPLSTSNLNGFPAFKVTLLTNPATRDAFLAAARKLVAASTAG